MEEAAELQDESDRARWQVQNLENDMELEILKAKESTREELRVAHAEDLRVRDDLNRLLMAKLASLERGRMEGAPVELDAKEKSSSKGGGSHGENASVGREKALDRVSPTSEDDPESASGRAHRLRLPTLPKYSGEDRDDGDALPRWLCRHDKHAEIECWSKREKLLQFELHLSGRAYEVLPK